MDHKQTENGSGTPDEARSIIWLKRILKRPWTWLKKLGLGLTRSACKRWQLS